MGARRSNTEQERERRLADLQRLDELFLRILGRDGFHASSLTELEERLRRIQETIHDAYTAGLTVSEMLDLVETDDAARELVFQVPDLVLHDQTGAACGKIWERILDTKTAMLSNYKRL